MMLRKLSRDWDWMLVSRSIETLTTEKVVGVFVFNPESVLRPSDASVRTLRELYHFRRVFTHRGFEFL